MDSSINFATANPHVRHLIADHVFKARLKFHEQTITIMEPQYHGPKRTIREHNGRIIIDRYENAQRILSNFGHVMTNIEFDASRFNNTEIIRIAELINAHCARSAEQMVIKFRSEDLAVNWTNAFTGVKHLSLDKANHFGELPYSQLFPRVQSLVLRLFDNVWDLSRDLSFLEVNLPHLTHASIDIGSSKTTSPSLLAFLRLNPQLRSFATTNFIGPDYLQQLATSLPHLDALSLASHGGDSLCSRPNKTTRFDSVRTLSLDLYRKPPLGVPLSFKNLRSLHLRTHRLYEPYIDFIGRCEQLETLEIGDMNDIRPTYDELKRIVGVSPRLQELRVALEKDVTGDGISRLLTEKSQLQRIIVELYAYSQKGDVLLAKLANGWALTGKTVFLDTLTEKLTFTRA